MDFELGSDQNVGLETKMDFEALLPASAYMQNYGFCRALQFDRSQNRV